MGKIRGEKRFHTVPTRLGGDGGRELESSEEEESDDVEQERRRRRVRRQRSERGVGAHARRIVTEITSVEDCRG